MMSQAETYRSEISAPDDDTDVAALFYEDNYSYLADELQKLNILLRLRTAVFHRQWQNKPEPAGQHLYISHEETDWLLNREATSGPSSADETRLREDLSNSQSEIDARVAGSLKRGIFMGLPQLARLFGLSAFETGTVLICLAPELRRSYDRLYAYLQDDITRKRPSVDLVLDLLCETEQEKWNARPLLSETAPLFRSRILQRVEDTGSPSGSSGLAQFLRLDPRILHFVLSQQIIDARLDGLVELRRTANSEDAVPIDPAIKASLLSFARRNFLAETGPRRRAVLHLHGSYGVGKRDLALALCDSLGCPLLCLDAERLIAQDDQAETLLLLAVRESLLLQAPLYVVQADVFLGEDVRAALLRKMLAQAVEMHGWLVFLAGKKPWPYRDLFEQMLFYSAALPMPAVPTRESAWKQALQTFVPDTSSDDLTGRLAARFRITPGQIREAAMALAHRRTVHEEEQTPTFAALAATCRAQAHHHLGTLAVKVDPHYDWADLILPDDKLAQLGEICSQMRYHYQIYDRWGFAKKLSHGKGLSALFTGPPGTGKTMAAEVIAHDLQLDLYKIDLARVVSKYIGETEKNLSQIFAEAENSNTILFFDEADALFGKRTEISDAHDRYANIETSYLLQKMEEYEGMVILASNLRENMDSAFLRRIRFIVEFPFPDKASRLQIWKTHFPSDAPVSESVDYELLAERVQVAGGNIKNIVLNAAFFAAADGGVIGMEHLVRGTRREFEKIGKLWDERALVQRQ